MDLILYFNTKIINMAGVNTIHTQRLARNVLPELQNAALSITQGTFITDRRC